MTLLLGEIETDEILGDEFPNDTLDEVLEIEAPLASVALAVHEIESLGETTLELSCHVAPVEFEPFEADHA